MTTSRLHLALPLLVVSLCAAAQECRFRAGDLELLFRDGAADLAAGSHRSPPLLRRAALRLTDGRTGAALPLGVPRREGDPAAPTLAWGPEPELAVHLAVRAVGRCLVWEVTCRNRGTTQRWLEVGPSLVLSRPPQAHWFDGWDDFGLPEGDRQSDRVGGNLPLTAVWDADVCVAVGLEPTQLVSYFRHGIATAAENGVALSCMVRCVVDPGASEVLRFVLLAAPGEWGKYEALEAYYDSFPACFRPHPDLDPRASLGSSQYRTWPAGPWSPEICRRLYAGWDWCYAPFRRTGDIVGREELWDYTPVRPFGTRPSQPRTTYLDWRRQAFTDGEERCRVAMMFYIPAQVWCEEQLARERYPDALVTDPRAKTYFSTPWVTGHDNELLVFPYGTSFGEQTRKDLADVAAELRLSGFAFDTAGGVARYTGPALPTLQGRAWDPALGVYCSELVAVARLMDFVHSLRREGRALAVVANPMADGSYASCVHCDSAMLERNPWQHSRTEADRLRWKLGRKTMVWWEGYDIGDFVDLATVTPAQLATVYEGLADFTLLQSLRVGAVPTPNFTQGVARLVRWLPTIVDCVQTGWEPVTAVQVGEPAWASRYGRGLETRLALAHETGQAVSVEAVVQNARLSPGTLLFTYHDGAVLRNRATPGTTVIALDLPVRTPVVLRAAIEVEPRGAVHTADVSLREGVAQARLEATLSGQGEAAVRIRAPAGMIPRQASADGRPVPFTVAGDVAEIRLRLAERSALAVDCASDLFQLPDEDLLGFPFAIDGRAGCAIVVSPGSAPTARREAGRLQEYFRYWYGRAVQPPTALLIPIQEDPGIGATVFVRTAPGSNAAVRREGANLIVEAPTGAALATGMDRLLRALDRRYWTCDQFGQTAVRERLAAYGRD